MNPYFLIARAYAAFREWQLARVGRDPAGTQERILRALVRRAAGTDWGREHGYASIASLADYQRRVPVCDYAAMRPWWERCFEGRPDVTWPGRVRYFAQTSGTTSGEKYVPVTPALLRSHAKVAADVMVLYRRRGAARLRRALAGKVLALGGSTALERRGTVLWGDASGIAARSVRWPLARRYLPGRDLAGIADWETRISRIAERVVREDVTLLTGIPSWVGLLLERVCRAAGSDGPASLARVWPNLTLFVHGGVFFEPYRPAFEQFFAGLDVDCVNFYGASEASIAVQSEPDDPALLLVVDAGIFYEFVPLDRWGRPDAPRLTVADVRAGEPYVILVTTCAGLWSYDLGDIVRFTSLRPLKLLITGRHRQCISPFGENVIGEYVEEAVVHACRLTGARVAEFTVGPRYADPPRRPRPAHEYVIEFVVPPPDPGAFARAIDAKVAERSLDYAVKRRGDLLLGPVEVTPVPAGTFYEWMRRRGMLGGQHKVPRCAGDRSYVDSVRAIAGL